MISMYFNYSLKIYQHIYLCMANPVNNDKLVNQSAAC